MKRQITIFITILAIGFIAGYVTCFIAYTTWENPRIDWSENYK
jgi:hypothetical protein